MPENYYLRHMTGALVVGRSDIPFDDFPRALLHRQGRRLRGIEECAFCKTLRIHSAGPSGFVLKLLVTPQTFGLRGLGGTIARGDIFLGANGWRCSRPSIGSRDISVPAGLAHQFLRSQAWRAWFAVSTGAAITALVMVFEMTLRLQWPFSLWKRTVAASNGIRAVLSRETIYTLKVARRGHFMPNALRTNFPSLKHAKKHHGKSSCDSSVFHADRGFRKAGYPGRRLLLLCGKNCYRF